MSHLFQFQMFDVTFKLFHEFHELMILTRTLLLSMWIFKAPESKSTLFVLIFVHFRAEPLNYAN